MTPPLAVEAAMLSEGEVLGRGGQGRVVEVLDCAGWPSGEPLVAKWYLPAVALDAGALTRLVAWRRSMDAADRSAVDAVACWPRSVLLRDGRAAGVLLPRVADRFAFALPLPSGATAQVLRELQHLIAGPKLLAGRGMPEVDVAARLRLLARFAAAVALLHGHGVVLGDLSVKNVLWSTVDETVCLIDCDALRLVGTNPAVPQPNSPGWDDPSFPGTQNQQSDRYKVALTVLRVLARDFHTRDAERAAEPLGHRFLPLLRAGLHGGPDHRPPVSAWIEPLDQRAQELSNE